MARLRHDPLMSEFFVHLLGRGCQGVLWRGGRGALPGSSYLEASQTRELLRRKERDASRGSPGSFTRAKNALLQDDNHERLRPGTSGPLDSPFGFAQGKLGRLSPHGSSWLANGLL